MARKRHLIPVGSVLRDEISRARRIMHRMVPILRRNGLTLEEWLVLDALAERDGQSMAQLAAATSATNATLSRHVDSLVSRALIYREVGAMDRRQFNIHLARRGVSLHAGLEDQLGEVVDEF